MTDANADHGRVSTRPWSVSESHAMAECPRAWWFRYVAKAVPAQPRSVKQIIGSAIHAGLEAAYVAAQTDISPVGSVPRAGLPLSTAHGLAALTAFSAYWDANGADVRDYEREDAERLLLELLDILITPHVREILGVEERFSFPISPQVTMYGVMDLVLNTSTATDKSIHIRDWKLGPVPTDEKELQRNMQLCTYAGAAMRRWPWVERVTVGLFSIREHREIRTVLHPDSIEQAARELAHDAETARLRAERKWVEPITGEHCGGCRFRSYCPKMNRTRPPVMDGVDVAAERARLNTLLNH